jgi:hypothetical protein
MLEPLFYKTSLAVRTDKRDERQRSEPWFGPLNRHGVLHGLDTDYATEENSLRTVILLQYLLDVDRILREDLPERLAELNRFWQETLDERSTTSGTDSGGPLTSP